MNLEPQLGYASRQLQRSGETDDHCRIVLMTPDAGATRSSRQIETHVITDESEFDRLAIEWDALLANSAQQGFFLRHAWNRSWWRHLAPAGARLHIICCRDGNGRLVGIAPMYWRSHRMLGIPYVRELALIGMGIEFKSSEYLDVIADRDHERGVAEAIAGSLKTQPDWDRFCLDQVPSESRMVPHLLDVFDCGKAQDFGDRARYIDTSVSWGEYRSSLGRSMRRNVEYYARRMFKLRPCEFRRVASRTEALEALTALVRLHQARWRAAGHPGSFEYPQVSALLGDVIKEEFDAGCVRLWTLSIEGEVQGALIGFLDNNVLHYFQKGFNPAFTKEDIGTVLLSLCIRDCFDDPQIHAFDFMRGGAPYKEMWARAERTTDTVVFERRNSRTRLLAARTTVREALASAYRRLTDLWLRAARRVTLKRVRGRFTRSDGGVDLRVLPFLGYCASEAVGILGSILPLDYLIT
jgi:CelD/BcsL family acetyltransferase involved in cellulose biosynthesis